MYLKEILIIFFKIRKKYRFVCLLLVINFATRQASADQDIDPKKSIVWGPGLRPTDIVLPARYFYIHLADKNGNRLNTSINENLEVTVGGTKDNFCRVWVQTLNRKDGSFIVRYKVYHICKKMRIDVQYKKISLKGFPKDFKEPVLPDECVCPISLNEWTENMKCRKTYKQISADLKNFQTVNFEALRKTIIDRYNRPTSVSLCHYMVKDNSVYRNCYGQYVGFKIFMDSILLSLARKVKLPDLEFFVNLGDWPLVKDKTNVLPIFSWCGSDDSYDIVMPTYDLTESTLECMGRVMLDMLSVQGNSGPIWSEKIGKVFWRGRDSREERLKLIDIARQNPDIFNASLTNFFFFRDQQEKYGPKEQHISFFDFFQYKYQLNIDGTVAAYRMPYLLAGESAVLKQDSNFYEHFYSSLKPNIHFVPFKRDLSDLVGKVQWLIDNDDEAIKIAIAARNFARKHLQPADVLCYYVVLFKEWSARLESNVEVQPGMELVPQPKTETECLCPQKLAHDEL